MKPAIAMWWCHYMLEGSDGFSAFVLYTEQPLCIWDNIKKVSAFFPYKCSPGNSNWSKNSPIRAGAHVAHLLIPSTQVLEFPTYLWESHPSAFTPPNPPASFIPGKCTVTIAIKKEKHKSNTTDMDARGAKCNGGNIEENGVKKEIIVKIFLRSTFVWICKRKMNKKKKESAMKVSVWTVWRIVGAGFACSGEWVSGALYF